VLLMYIEAERVCAGKDDIVILCLEMLSFAGGLRYIGLSGSSDPMR